MRILIFLNTLRYVIADLSSPNGNLSVIRMLRQQRERRFSESVLTSWPLGLLLLRFSRVLASR